MRLQEFSVTNFRSITKTSTIKMGDFTVLLGKNNEGKSNLLLALKIALQSIRDFATEDNAFLSKRNREIDIYKWNEDFPLQLQDQFYQTETQLVCKFNLDSFEMEDLLNKTNLSETNIIDVEIKIGKENIPIISILKPENVFHNNNSKLITEYISNHLLLNYIPAIRTEKTVKESIEESIYTRLLSLQSDEMYSGALKNIISLEDKVLKELSNDLNKSLKIFIPNIRDTKINFISKNRYFRTRFQSVSIKIDDGQLTEVSSKGDGIKSLIALAILSGKSKGVEASIVAIEEPESHLHPGAIHNILNILNNISKSSQIIITTHSPLFVRRNHIRSNIIVGDGVAKQANNIKEIRDILGVCMEDNLQNTRFVLLVEGDDDKKSLNKILSLKSKIIEESLNNNIFSIKPMGGSGNLIYNIIELNNNLCSFFALLDNDSAGKAALEKVEKNNNIDSSTIKLTLCDGMKESEFEDCIKEEFYKDLFSKEFKVDIKIGCKNKNKKWSDRMKDIFNSQGTGWNDNIKEKAKMLIANEISESKVSTDEILIKQKSGFIDSLVFNLEELIKNAD